MIRLSGHSIHKAAIVCRDSHALCRLAAARRHKSHILPCERIYAVRVYARIGILHRIPRRCAL